MRFFYRRFSSDIRNETFAPTGNNVRDAFIKEVERIICAIFSCFRPHPTRRALPTENPWNSQERPLVCEGKYTTSKTAEASLAGQSAPRLTPKLPLHC